MKKALLILFLTSFVNSANAFELNDDVKKQLEKYDINYEEISTEHFTLILNKIKTMVESDSFSANKLSIPQINKLKEAYAILKAREIKDPELKKIRDKIIAKIDGSGLLK